MNTYERSFSVTLELEEETGVVLRQVWRDSNGKENNPIGPAIVDYDQDGAVTQETWMRNGEPSRLQADGAAIRIYNPTNGVCIREIFIADGCVHRVRGPAIIDYDQNTGDVISQKHFQLGQPISGSLTMKPV